MRTSPARAQPQDDDSSRRSATSPTLLTSGPLSVQFLLNLRYKSAQSEFKGTDVAIDMPKTHVVVLQSHSREECQWAHSHRPGVASP